MKLDQNLIDKTMVKPWTADGTNFSKRILGKYRPELVKKLHDGLTQNLILGKSPDKLIDEIQKQFGVKKSQSENLVRTEKAYFMTVAQNDCFSNLGVEQYEVVATLDTKTSDICRSMDGKVFDMKDFAPGSTAPPFHNRCRTATAPYFNDEFDDMGERAARDKDGNYYTVPSNMKYDDWYKSFVEGGNKDDLSIYKKVVSNTSIISESIQSFFDSLDNDNGSESHKQLLRYYAQTTEYIEDNKFQYPFAYSPSKDAIIYNPSFDGFEEYDLNETLVHELSHRADVLKYKSWEQEVFMNAIDKAKKNVYDNFDKYEKMFTVGGIYEEALTLSDIFSALTENDMDLPAGHSASYWNQGKKYKALEIFANISSIDQYGSVGIDEFKSSLKELFDEYRKIVGD